MTTARKTGTAEDKGCPGISALLHYISLRSIKKSKYKLKIIYMKLGDMGFFIPTLFSRRWRMENGEKRGVLVDR